MSEIREGNLESKEQKTETNNKNTPEELPVLQRMTKRQVQEVYDLLDQEKSYEEISKFFEQKYKCKPLSRDRLRKHAAKFYSLKREREENGGVENNKSHSLQPPVSIITNQDIREIKDKMFSPPPNNNLSKSLESVESGETVSKERDDTLFSAIPMKFLVFAVIVILLVLTILMRRKERKAKSKPEEPEQQNKSGNLRIKWV